MIAKSAPASDCEYVAALSPEKSIFGVSPAIAPVTSRLILALSFPSQTLLAEVPVTVSVTGLIVTTSSFFVGVYHEATSVPESSILKDLIRIVHVPAVPGVESAALQADIATFFGTP
ncbi:unannotated protein [freshwater metagenome]|uniref:Unannotated protein n=1 Tax=freshwater metagenome TaxID=449393 RepID=A0A6J5YYP3_9ZZZZ